MKRFIITFFVMLAIGSIALHAKKQPEQRIYMFGMAASFTDTIVHFTSMQVLDSVTVDAKSKVLPDRQIYSYQLRDYLDSNENMPHRTCVVFYSTKKEKLEKKLEKMVKLYTPTKANVQHFDVRIISPQQFHFTKVNYEAVEEPSE